MQMEIFAELKAPEFSVCIRYIDLFNYSRFSRDTNISLIFTNETAMKDIKRLTFDTVTLADIFKYTPNIDDMYSGCEVKLPSSYNHVSYIDNDCNRIFNTRKFHLSEFVCYAIQVKKSKNDTYYYSQLGYSLTHQSLLYTFELKYEHFDRADFIKLILNAYCDGDISCAYQNSFPDVSSAYGTPLFRNYNALKKTTSSNSYMVTYFTVTHNRLSAPYNTDCRDYTIDKKFIVVQRACYGRCLKNLTLTAFNKMPFSVPIGEPLNYKHIGIDDIRNSSRSHLLNEIDKKCSKACGHKDCHSVFTVTQVQTYKFGNRDLKFRINVPKKPSLVIHYKAKMAVAEVIIYSCSCIGTWLGISFLNLPTVLRSTVKCVKKLSSNGRVHAQTGLQAMNEYSRLHYIKLQRINKAHEIQIKLLQDEQVQSNKEVNELNLQIIEMTSRLMTKK